MLLSNCVEITTSVKCFNSDQMSFLSELIFMPHRAYVMTFITLISIVFHAVGLRASQFSYTPES